MIGIYKITSPTGKIYIGQSKNIPKRFKEYDKLQCKLQIVLYRSFLKYGVENHLFEIIEICDFEKLNKRERYWQDFFNVLNEGLNCKLTSTLDKKTVYSKETLEKMSKSLKGRVITKEWRENLSAAGRGRIFSEETKRKLTERNTGRFYSKETREKIGLNKPSCRIIIDENTGVFYYSIKDLAKNLNVNSSSLYDFLTNRKGSKLRFKNRNLSQYKLI